MQISTTQSLAKGIAATWREHYFVQMGHKWYRHCDEPGMSERIYNELVALGDSPTPEAIAKIIGNGGWTVIDCDECGSVVDAAATIGQEPDYESHTATICRECLVKAVAKIDEAARRID